MSGRNSFGILCPKITLLIALPCSVLLPKLYDVIIAGKISLNLGEAWDNEFVIATPDKISSILYLKGDSSSKNEPSCLVNLVLSLKR